MNTKPRSEETKSKTSESMKEWHANNVHSMQGKHHTEEAKAKIGAASKDRPVSEKDRAERAERAKMSSEKEQQIIAAYYAGKTYREIKKEFKTGASSIDRVLERNHIQKRA